VDGPVRVKPGQPRSEQMFFRFAPESGPPEPDATTLLGVPVDQLPVQLATADPRQD
jgi:hypothetical protein